MISCQDADVLAAALSVGSLDRADEASLDTHLAGCGDCRRVAGEYMGAAARLPLALEPLKPSPELRSRLMRAVYAEAAERGARAAAAEPAPWWRQLWARVPSARGFTVLAGAAAAVVIAGASWSLVNRQTGGPASVSVPVAATSSAPQAHGQLVYERGGTQAVLTVTGLPGPDRIAGASAVYEVWLIRPDGGAVPAAFLTQAPDGSWSAAMHGNLSVYSNVATTVEPPGGSHAPTGVEILQAPINDG